MWIVLSATITHLKKSYSYGSSLISYPIVVKLIIIDYHLLIIKLNSREW